MRLIFYLCICCCFLHGVVRMMGRLVCHLYWVILYDNALMSMFVLPLVVLIVDDYVVRIGVGVLDRWLSYHLLGSIRMCNQS